jgi:hypothetical protein
MLKRLTSEDSELLREAFFWTQDAPKWHRDMDSTFGPDNVEDFLVMLAEPENILIGIFNPDFVGLLIIACAGNDIFNAHLCAKRGTDLNVLAEGAYQAVQDFLRMGMKEGFCWVAEKNLAVRKLCDNIDFRHEGVVMYRGTYKGKLIKWLRYSIRAKANEMEIAA